MKSSKWKTEEDAIIIKNIKLYPNNLTYSFEQSSKELKGRSKDSCIKRYYKNLKLNIPNIIGIGSEIGIITNVKNTPRSANVIDPVQLVIKLFNKLTEKERIQALSIVFG